MTPPVRAAAGLVRVFGATARAMALDAAAGVAAGAESVAGAVTGRAPESATLRVQGLILADEGGAPLTGEDHLVHALQEAGHILTGSTGIRVRIDGIDILRDPAPTRVLDPPRNQRLLLDDVLGHTAFFRRHLAQRPWHSVVGDPVTVVIVRSIAGNATGCSLGMSADWVICQAALVDAANRTSYDPTVLAHEIGHALNLPHSRDPSNLMYGTSSPPDQLRGTALAAWQRAVMRANRHIVPPAP